MLKTDKFTVLLDYKLPLWGGHKNNEHNQKRIYKMLYKAKNVNGGISAVDRWEIVPNSFQLRCMFENDHGEKLEKVKQVKGFREWYVSVISWIRLDQ